MKKQIQSEISLSFLFASDAIKEARKLRKQGKKVKIQHILGCAFPEHIVHILN